MNIVHIITGLDAGGAESMLFKLLTAMDGVSYIPTVISLTTLGSVGERLRKRGIQVHALNMRRGLPDPIALGRLVSLLRGLGPDLVQTWMYHADLMGAIAARLGGQVPVVWNIRHSNLHPALNKRSTIFVARLCARLSHRLARRIVCCSEEACLAHSRLGYAKDRLLLIPNGFDLDLFAPDPASARDVRQELGLASTTPLIGLIARFHPQKGHSDFFKAASLLHQRLPEVHFLLAGQGVEADNHQLVKLIGDHSLRHNLHLLGLRRDIPRLTAALDIATSASLGEGFPNVLGEAMACAVPCVATDVGDSARIVASNGLIVPPADADQMAMAWQRILRMDPAIRKQLGDSARQRVALNYSLNAIAKRYSEVYDEVVATCVV